MRAPVIEVQSNTLETFMRRTAKDRQYLLELQLYTVQLLEDRLGPFLKLFLG